MSSAARQFNGPYRGENLNRIAFPLGGLGSGMVALEGGGALSHLSIRHSMDFYNEPPIFAAVCVKGETPGKTRARVLEGPVPRWKIFGPAGTGNGASGRTYGLPRFAEAEFEARFPFAQINLSDPAMPVTCRITGWSPFVPNDEADSGLPAAALEYRLTNASDKSLELVFSVNARNFMGTSPQDPLAVETFDGGFRLVNRGSEDEPWKRAAMAFQVLTDEARVNARWFRGGWFDAMTVAWKRVAEGFCQAGEPWTDRPATPGASVYVPITLAAGQSVDLPVLLSWHAGQSRLRVPEKIDGSCDCACGCETPNRNEVYRPWYAERFADAAAVEDYWRTNYDQLRQRSRQFSEALYGSTLPDEILEAVAANLTILKSPTVLRQADGRLWCWEGCCDGRGCCHGSCTHVWNYAQAMAHLFPAMERSLRETEFEVAQDDRGHQNFRVNLPISEPTHDHHAAADGQLGGIMKLRREWRLCGDDAWLARLWPRVVQSMDYCIATWDPRRAGVLEEPHHNTYDIEFWGPDGMCGSFYIGALAAMVEMGEHLGEPVDSYRKLYDKARAFMESDLFDGEYFIQKVQWQGLAAGDPTEVKPLVHAENAYSPEAADLLAVEGPKYQYGTGCLSDGVLGAWIAEMCGQKPILDNDKVRSHLRAIHKYNLKTDLSDHANPQRPSYAVGNEGGLLLCTWPKGGRPTLPFVYSDEVWTGIEYQVASHLIALDQRDAALEIVRTCRARYDGRVRNPFNEYECGHWYGRALASYGLLTAWAGLSYDGVTRTLTIARRPEGDVRCLLSVPGGYGVAGIKDGKPFVEVIEGAIEVDQFVVE